MTDMVRRLLETYEFCRTALANHRHRLDAGSIRKLEIDRDRAFSDLATHVSTNPRVTLAQVQLLLSGLAFLAEDKSKAEHLRKVCADAVARRAPKPKQSRARSEVAAERAGALPAMQLRQALDSLPERVAIVDSTYHYLYTNPANAEFHGMSVAEMQKLPAWRVIGTRAFETVMRQQYNRCIEGQNFAITTRRSGNRFYRCHLAPLLGDDGRPMAAIVTVRDLLDGGAGDVVAWDVSEPDV